MAKTGKQVISDRLYDRGVAQLATKSQCEYVVEEVINIIYRALLSGETVNLPPIGIFSVKNMAARNGRNPKTGDAVAIPARRKVSFKQGERMKISLEKVDQGESVDSITY
jgi:DNA-binding protein HU-beta